MGSGGTQDTAHSCTAASLPLQASARVGAPPASRYPSPASCTSPVPAVPLPYPASRHSTTAGQEEQRQAARQAQR